MKKYFIRTSLIITLLVILGIALAFYLYRPPATTEVDVLSDITEKFIARPDANEILNLYGLSASNMWNGAAFYYSDVTDVSYNQTTEVKIDAANEWLSNELERDKEVKGFENSVRTIISTDISDSIIGRQNSSIYLPIAQQLVHLSQSKAQKKILLVYSDLMENDPDLSFYSKKEFQLIQTNPDVVEKQLEGLQALPSLAGIEIHLVFQPVNPEEDNEYRVVSRFYKTTLQAKGATVFISANLSN